MPISLEDFAGKTGGVALDNFAAPDPIDAAARSQSNAPVAYIKDFLTQAGDMVFGLPGDIVAKTLNAGTRFRGAFSGESQKTVGQAGEEAEALVPEGAKSPVSWLRKQFGGGEIAPEGMLGEFIDKHAEGIEKGTGGWITKEDAKFALGALTDVAMASGARGAFKAKPKVGTVTLDEFVRPPEVSPALPSPAQVRAPIEGEFSRVDEEAPRLTQKGSADPKLLAAIAAGGGLGAWIAANPDEAQQLALGGMLVGAIKPAGGMWHPEAVERLSGAIAPRTRAGLQEVPVDAAMRENSDRMVKGYLNKYAGTERDPLKDVEVPFGEGTKRWEEVTDLMVAGTKGKDLLKQRLGDRGRYGEPLEQTEMLAKQIKPDEMLWRLENPRSEVTHAFTSYLSHVGDYLREKVDPRDLSRYDLVRAVKETVKWDAELAKNMEKARQDDTAGSPIYKDYGDGMRWIQLTKPGQFARESDAMGHSVRGYEPQAHMGGTFTATVPEVRTGKPHPDWTPASGDSGHPSYGLGGWEAIKRGDAKVYSLRDAKGESHVTIETGVGEPPYTGRFTREANAEAKASTPSIITQIKGKQNRAPAAEYLPFVQDFVKSGKWGEVGDLEHAQMSEGPDGTYLTEAEAKAKGLEPQENPDGSYSFRQRGSIDPKLAIRLGAMALGGVIGANVAQDPWIGAIVGALGAGALTKLSPKGVAEAVKGAFAKDTRVRVDHLADAWDAAISKAGRAIWQQQMDVADAVPKAVDRAAITKAIQSGTVDSLPPTLRAAANQAREFFAAMGKQGQESGVLKDLIDNYVTNLWDLNGANKRIWDEILRKAGGPSMSAESRFALKRSIANLEVGKKLGLVPKTEDIAEIMGLYGNSLARSMANKQMIEALKAEEHGGEKLVMSSLKAPHEYVSIDHPQLAGLRVHPDIAPSLRFVFDNSQPGKIMAGLSAVNTATKRMAVSFSLFHAKALTDALLGAASNPVTAGKVLVTSALGTNKYLQMLRNGGAGDLVDKAIEGGLKFTMEKGKLADEDVNGSFYTGLKMMQDGLDSLVPGLGLPVKAVTKMNHLVDTFMWERLHAGMKLSIFAEKYERLLQNGADPKQAAKDSASFSNDTFGGLNWRRMAEAARTKWGRDIALAAYSPTGRRMLQLSLFAPDWTISTTRAALKAFGTPLGYEAGSGVKGIWKPQNVTDLHRQYILRSALYYGLIGSALNYYFSGHPLWENKDPTTIDMGDGRTMQWSKHTMESVHWLTKPVQQGLNKLGFLPREGLNQAFGTEYLSPRTDKMGNVTAGPAMKESRLEHLGKSVAPIAGQQAFGSSATPESAISGFFGAPIYGTTLEQRAKEEEKSKARAQWRRENRMDNPAYNPDKPKAAPKYLYPETPKSLRRASAEGPETSFVKTMRAMEARERFRADERDELIREAKRRFGKNAEREFLRLEEQAEIRKVQPRGQTRRSM